MKIIDALLPSVAEQIERGDDTVIDPWTVILAETPITAFVNFDYLQSNLAFGSVIRIWVEDERLMGEIDVFPGMEPVYASVGGSIESAGFRVHAVGISAGDQARRVRQQHARQQRG